LLRYRLAISLGKSSRLLVKHGIRLTLATGPVACGGWARSLASATQRHWPWRACGRHCAGRCWNCWSRLAPRTGSRHSCCRRRNHHLCSTCHELELPLSLCVLGSRCPIEAQARRAQPLVQAPLRGGRACGPVGAASKSTSLSLRPELRADLWGRAPPRGGWGYWFAATMVDLPYAGVAALHWGQQARNHDLIAFNTVSETFRCISAPAAFDWSHGRICLTWMVCLA
jgi:hypothetical protein